MVIYSASWEEHLSHLAEVFLRIKAAGLVVNAKKYSLAKSEVSYLGYVLGGGVIKPQVDKMDAVHSYPAPTTKKEGQVISRPIRLVQAVYTEFFQPGGGSHRPYPERQATESSLDS